MTTHTMPSVSFVQAVLLRSGMYTQKGTALEVIAFLEGWHSGLAKNKPDAVPVLTWEAFRVWLAGELGVEPAQAFAAFMQQHGSEQTATRTLYDYFSGFLQAHQTT